MAGWWNTNEDLVGVQFDLESRDAWNAWLDWMHHAIIMQEGSVLMHARNKTHQACINFDFNPDAFTDYLSNASAIRRDSPLVLDLDGDDIETAAVDGGAVMFDHDGDGRKSGTGWISADDGFLVFDRNGDGTINNGR